MWSSLSKSKYQWNWICSCSHIQISFAVFTDCFGLQSCKTPWSHAWIDVFPQVMPLLKQKKLILAPWCETAECFPQISTHCFTGDPVTCPFYWEIFCAFVQEWGGYPNILILNPWENDWISGYSLNLQTNPSNSQRNIHPETWWNMVGHR